jgi:hypothetical protein
MPCKAKSEQSRGGRKIKQRILGTFLEREAKRENLESEKIIKENSWHRKKKKKGEKNKRENLE